MRRWTVYHSVLWGERWAGKWYVGRGGRREARDRNDGYVVIDFVLLLIVRGKRLTRIVVGEVETRFLKRRRIVLGQLVRGEVMEDAVGSTRVMSDVVGNQTDHVDFRSCISESVNEKQ